METIISFQLKIPQQLLTWKKKHKNTFIRNSNNGLTFKVGQK